LTGRRIGELLQIPVFLYESAATRPERKDLAEQVARDAARTDGVIKELTANEFRHRGINGVYARDLAEWQQLVKDAGFDQVEAFTVPYDPFGILKEAAKENGYRALSIAVRAILSTIFQRQSLTIKGWRYRGAVRWSC
jgi:hypothetical protein